MGHCRGVLSRSSRRPTCVTTRPPLPQLTTTTYLYLLWHPEFLALILTVVNSLPWFWPLWYPLRRSVPVISRFCPTLGWLPCVKSVTHVHRRCSGYHNPNCHGLSKSGRLTYLSVYDNRDRTSESAFSPSNASESVLSPPVGESTGRTVHIR